MAEDDDADPGALEAQIRALDERGLEALRDLVAQARTRMEAVAAEFGVSLAEVARMTEPAAALPAVSLRRARTKRIYRNPENPQ